MLNFVNHWIFSYVLERVFSSLEFGSYRQAREDEKNATKRLNDMITNYYDVIPRRDFETLEAKHNVSLKWVYSYIFRTIQLSLTNNTITSIQYVF